MAAKRRARRPRSDDSTELGRNGVDKEEEEEEEEEECGKSGETAMSAEPKERPLKQAEQSSPPSTKDAGAQGSGEASPARSAPRGGVALETKTTSKHVKKPPPASLEEDEAGDSGDASPARDPLPDDTTDAGHSKRAVTPKREEGSHRPHQGEEHEEQQGEGIPHQEQPNDTSPSRERKRYQDNEETGAQVNSKVLPPRSSKVEKKPAVERSWSHDDELKILNALVKHAQSHNGVLPESSHLLANLTFDKIDATEDKLTDKIRKLRARYYRIRLQGCPSDILSRRLFKLSEILWGQVDEDEQVEPTSRDFSALSKLYPHLAKEVRAYAESHSSGDLVMSMFMTIDDDKAHELDAKCKKQHIEAFKLELSQASLTNELLSALSNLITKTTDPSQATPCKRSAKEVKEPLDEQYPWHSKRVARKTEGFTDKPNADEVLNPKPLAMVPAVQAPKSLASPPHQGHWTSQM